MEKDFFEVFILLFHKAEEIKMPAYLWVSKVVGAGFFP